LVDVGGALALSHVEELLSASCLVPLPLSLALWRVQELPSASEARERVREIGGGRRRQPVVSDEG